MQIEKSKNALSKPHTPFLLKAEILLFLLVLTFVCKIIISEVTKGKRTEASDLTIENILNAVNHEREIRNIGTLNTNSKLSSAASWKASDMIERNYFAHVDPDGNYIWPKIIAAGYTPYLQLGENLAIEFYNTESLVQAWMNSPTHRANLLNEGFKDQGMGLSFGKDSQYHSSIANTFGTLQILNKPKVETAPAPTPAPAPTTTPKPVIKTTKPVTKTPTPETVKTPPAPISTPSSTTQATSSEQVKPSTIEAPKEEIAKQEPTSTPPLNTQVIKPRQNELAENTINTFPNENTETKVNTTTSLPVFNTNVESKNKNAESNRYLVLTLGVVILLILSQDIKIYISKKSGSFPDKKINNVAVLILSLIVIGLIYWM